ncbi:asparagine synthase C-terminal domain-containing protein [Streptomyces noursei]|uniref:asparagine synthase C-terminal domain-containing protein n=1 Tax=Streptomyces noursei TaxID=1971 RepID=UPI001672A967|nr:asparagine synthase C-terminal domain-containing protein [Streptomyces noursei]MCZ1013823.1 MFS transporter [Streptomyces noursei]GGX33535.1 hypothetical protein GCM10010341_63740 [Streptomyces noursei]
MPRGRTGAHQERWGLVAVAGICAFLAMFDMSVVTVAVPDIAAGFDVPVSVAHWAALAYQLPVVALLLPAGRWLDRAPLRPVVLGALAGFGLRSYAVDYSDQAERFTGDVLRTGHDAPYAVEAGAFIGAEHDTVVLDPHTLLDPGHRAAVVVARDSPIGVGDMDTSLHLLFGKIKEHSTVAVSGEAADEVFGGYPWFHSPAARAAETFPWLLVTEDEAAMPLHPDLAGTLRIGEFQRDTYRAALAAVPHLDEEGAAQRRQRELQHLSLTRWLRQLLHRKDRLSMAQGLEVRVPYCDHRLVEYAFNTPWELQTHDGREKSLLRAVGAGLAPPSVLWRAKNHYPATHHPDYNRGLQKLAREALDAAGGRVRDLVDERVVGSCLTTEPERLEWGHRLRLERVVDLALWLDHYRPEIAV